MDKQNRMYAFYHKLSPVTLAFVLKDLEAYKVELQNGLTGDTKDFAENEEELEDVTRVLITKVDR